MLESKHRFRHKESESGNNGNNVTIESGVKRTSFEFLLNVMKLGAVSRHESFEH